MNHDGNTRSGLASGALVAASWLASCVTVTCATVNSPGREEGGFEMRSGEVGDFEMRLVETGAFEMCPLEKGEFEMRPVEVGAP
jgi:hypothetical protein